MVNARTVVSGWFGLLLALGGPLLSGAEEDLRVTEVLRERFDDNARNWPWLSVGQNWESAIEAGVLRWKNLQAEGSQFTRLALPVSARRKHEISADVRLLDGAEGQAAGLEWAHGEAGHYELLLTRGGQLRIVQVSAAERNLLAERDLATAFRSGEFNRLTLRVLGAESAVFLNGQVGWIGPTLAPFGAGLGFRVEGGVTAEFDNVVINYLRAEEAQFAERLAEYRTANDTPGQVVLPHAVPSGAAVTVAGGTAAETQESRFREGLALIKARQFAQAEALFDRVLAANPDHGAARVQKAWCLLQRQAFDEAQAEVDRARAVDPFDHAALAVTAYTAGAKGNWAAVEPLLKLLVAADLKNALPPLLDQDLTDLAGQTWGATLAAEFRQRLNATAVDPHLRAVFARLDEQRAAQATGAAADAISRSREYAAAVAVLPPAWAHVRPELLHVAGRDLFSSNDPRRGQPLLEEAYTTWRVPAAPKAGYLRVENTLLLAMLALNGADAARAHALLVPELTAALQLPAAANRLKGDFLRTAAEAANVLGDRQALLNYGPRLLALRGTGRDPYFEYLGHTFHAAAYALSNLPPDRERLVEHAERALGLARQHRMTAEIEAATSNLAIVHWHAGRKQQARDLYLQTATEGERRGDFASAEVSLNNLGALQFTGGDYTAAAATFRRAVALTETARARLPLEERIRFLGSRLSAYQFLASCLERAGDAAGLFEVANAMRGRALAETLSVGEPPAITLAQFQSGLVADEMAIFYTVVGPAELVIQVVDRSSATATRVDARPFLVPLKERYLDQLHRDRPGYKPLQATVSAGGTTYQNVRAADQITTRDLEATVELLRGLIDGSVSVPADLRSQLLPEFLGTLAQALIQPIERKIGMQRKLILFPDQVLYFVPFEALPAGGHRYLIERADVRYCQSAAVWALLRGREYPADRRSFFGMGGANYHAMEEQAPPLADATRHVQLQVQAQRNAAEGRSQREIYAALFGSEPMTYLQGSLVEVQVLSRLFPDAAVFTGDEMTEPRLKHLSRDGTLAGFRILHLATHGFVVPEAPELSGIAMSIYPTAQDGEDGYLTAPEVARLGLRADLAVLSACDTGRGRIYGGEGVQGLTGSLLIGGANRALVSLWPVSDAGTMRFMTDLYALTLSEGKSYDEAVNHVKRRFIAGEYGDHFRDLQIWAPFVHYGR